MKKTAIFLLLIVSSITLCARELSVPETRQLPTPGKWDRASWLRSLRLHSFVKLGNQEEPRLESTNIRMLHNGENLAILAEVGLPEKIKLLSNKKTHDSDVTVDDCLEFFFQPSGSKKIYQLVINPIGTVMDLSVLNGQEDLSWNCDGLQVSAKKANGLWDVQLLIPLRSIGLNSVQTKFLFNAALTDQFRGREKHWSLAPCRNRFNESDKFIQLQLGDQKTPALEFSSSACPELIDDNNFEYYFSTFKKTGLVYSSKYHAWNGKSCIMFENKDGHTVTEIRSKPFAVVPGETLRGSAALFFHAVLQPDFSPVRLEFFNKEHKLIRMIHAPGMKNSGAQTSVLHKLYDFTVTVPEGSVQAELIWHLNGTSGAYRLDGISLRKNFPAWSLPSLLTPSAKSVFRKNSIFFNWSEIRIPGAAKDGYHLQVSSRQNFQNPEIDVPYIFPGYTATVPVNGVWFWRVGYKDAGGKMFWTVPETFTIDCAAGNERNKPVIDQIIPTGRINALPEYLTILFHDPIPSSGINKSRVRLIVNQRDVTTQSEISENRIRYSLRGVKTDFVSFYVEIPDRNGNVTSQNGYIYVSPVSVKLTQDKAGFIVRNGKRVFPISFYAVILTNSYPKMLKNGMNANMSPWGDLDRNIAHLNAAWHNNMYLIPYASGPRKILNGSVAMDSPAGQKLQKQAIQEVKTLADHPGLLGLYTGDEDMDGNGTKPEIALSWYRLLKKEVPGQLTYWLPTFRLCEPELIRKSAPACDLFVWHSYCVNQRDKFKIVRTMDVIRNASNQKPHYLIVEAFKYGANGVFPEYEDIRFQTFFGIASKSRGIVFYTSQDRRDFANKDPYATEKPGYLDVIFSVSKEIAELQKALVADDCNELHKVKTNSGKLLTLGKVVDSTLYIFAVNISDKPFSGEISANWMNVTIDKRPVSGNLSVIRLKLPVCGVAVLKGTLKK